MNPMYITFGLYLVAVLGIGLVAYFSTKNFDDYILGGRSLGAFVTAMSAGASDMSGWLLMGLPGAIYLSGFSEAWIAIGLTVGAYFNWLWVAGRLRVHTEYNNNALTLPDYFYHRFGGKDAAEAFFNICLSDCTYKGRFYKLYEELANGAEADFGRSSFWSDTEAKFAFIKGLKILNG